MAEALAGGERAGTVDQLWSDIPPVSGARKADLAIPLGARLIIRAMMQGRVNFIAFTTDRSAQEVQDFYSKERMAASGWTAADAGCVGDSDEQPSQGAVCFFIRPNDNRENGLAIVVAEDSEKGETHIFYARFDIIPEEELERQQERSRSRN
jgi:hypothetical protein